MIIELETPMSCFGGIDAEIDRIQVVSIHYNKHRGREPHLDIGVEVGKWIDERTETNPVEHPGWRMVDGENGEAPSRVCHECEAVQVWKEEGGSGEWQGDHDMEACLANREPETRVIEEAHIKWLGGTSIIVRADQMEKLKVAFTFETIAGAFIDQIIHAS